MLKHVQHLTLFITHYTALFVTFKLFEMAAVTNIHPKERCMENIGNSYFEWDFIELKTGVKCHLTLFSPFFLIESSKTGARTHTHTHPYY